MATYDNVPIDRYLNDSENPFAGLISSTYRLPRQFANEAYDASTCSTISQDSTSTVSPYSENDESVFSMQSRGSYTTATSRQSIQSNPVAGWNLPIPQISQINTTIVLPCEFISINCGVAFHPDDFDNWLAHSLTHFKNLPPPSKCFCLFCDKEFEGTNDSRSNWWGRMMHSRDHFLDGETNIRPDFSVIEYMRRNNLMDEADYTLAGQYTERPSVPSLVRKGFETPESKLKRERESKVPCDLQKEERHRKRSGHAYKRKERQGSTFSRKHMPVSIEHPEYTRIL
ncbi:uncharacterized protein Bfra_003611 [Botrytis fragariae]|uniref:Uncharacterized protein n=1 Tax=Botrytis fragariae TaxID=1964551 RepID=A0A8H6AX08_9HELO|nr:uncharacterized protein Bfra_003611 [Botrytis fragariae]KAF5875158.1 hypothetical protein Bfra_003611 [Botrytis fragariae]